MSSTGAYSMNFGDGTAAVTGTGTSVGTGDYTATLEHTYPVTGAFIASGLYETTDGAGTTTLTVDFTELRPNGVATFTLVYNSGAATGVSL